MKKQFKLTIVALIFSFLGFSQSGLNIGGSIGFPYENYEGYEFSFAFSIDANYLFELNQAFDLGIATGYGHAFGDNYNYYVGPLVGYDRFDTPDYQYVPIAAAARFNVNSKLVFGADVGYAVSLNSDKDVFNNDYYTGGFYWRPMVGFNLSERFQLIANYIGISDDYFYYSSVNLGFSVNVN